MPSINLIWEQRALRQRNQQFAMALLALVGLAVLVMGEEWGRTRLDRARCDAKIAECQQTIKKNEERAKENRELQAEIATLEPTLDLLQGAQRINIRWVQLLSELDAAVPNLRQVTLSQLNFVTAPVVVDAAATTTTTTPGSTTPAKLLIGTVNLSGTASDYPLIAATMRRLVKQRHIGDVRLTQAQLDRAASKAGDEPTVRFVLQVQFRIPENEEEILVAAAETPKRADYSEALQQAGEKTILNRVPSDVTDSQ
ncbi:MAG: PilN domain-containing protein [Armatimonadetes bacterium]|nr:PilN domain-containing protein [Armatimonadota bacterium]